MFAVAPLAEWNTTIFVSVVLKKMWKSSHLNNGKYERDEDKCLLDLFDIGHNGYLKITITEYSGFHVQLLD